MISTRHGDELSKAAGEQPLLGFQPLRDPNLEVVPKPIKVRHLNISIPSPVYKEWRQRSVPVAAEPHRIALMHLQRTIPNLNIELPTAHGNLATSAPKVAHITHVFANGRQLG